MFLYCAPRKSEFHSDVSILSTDNLQCTNKPSLTNLVIYQDLSKNQNK
jgi:hypothetical protein